MNGLASMLDTEVFELLKTQQEYLKGKAVSSMSKMAAGLAAAKGEIARLRTQLDTKDREKDAAVQAAIADMTTEVNTLERKIKVPPAPRTISLPALGYLACPPACAAVSAYDGKWLRRRARVRARGCVRQRARAAASAPDPNKTLTRLQRSSRVRRTTLKSPRRT